MCCTRWPGGPRTRCRPAILALLRDDGPAVPRPARRAARGLPDHDRAPRSGRLVELGLAEEGGPAASRGRSSVDAGRPRRRPAVRRASRSARPACRSAVTDGRLSVLGHALRACDVRRGPEAVLAAGARARCAACSTELGRRAARGRRRRRARPGRLPPRRPDVAADHARLGRLPGPRRPGPRAVLPGRAGQRRQRDGPRRAARRRRPERAPTSSSSRSAPASGAGSSSTVDLYRGVDGCAGDIGHIRVEEFGPTCACGNTGCLEAFAGGAALARDATAAARSGRSPALAARLEANGEVTAADIARGGRRGRRDGRPADPGQRTAGRAGAGRPGLVLQPRSDRRRRSGHRPGPRAARRDPGRDLPARRCRSPPATCRSCSASWATRPG